MRGFMRRRGPTWELRVSLGRDVVTGAQRYATRSVRGPRAGAERVLRDMVAAAEAGTTHRAGATFGSCARRGWSMPGCSWQPTVTIVAGRAMVGPTKTSAVVAASTSTPPPWPHATPTTGWGSGWASVAEQVEARYRTTDALVLSSHVRTLFGRRLWRSAGQAGCPGSSAPARVEAPSSAP